MKVLMTGATGLVGGAIVDELRKREIPIHYLSTSRDKLVVQENYKGFYWNPSKGELDRNALEGVTSIINLAGASVSKRWTPSYKKAILDSRIQSLGLLRNAVKEYRGHSLEHMVTASAIGIYPNSLTTLYDEDTTQTDDGFLGQVVKAWEDEAQLFSALGCKVAMIRIGLVLSDQGGALPKMAGPVKNYLGAAFGSGEQWQSWIHNKDLARLFIFVLETGLEGIFNGVAPNPVTNAKLTKELAKVLKRPLFLPNIPQKPMKLFLGEMAQLLFSSQRVNSKRIEELGFEFRYRNICNALTSFYGGDCTTPTAGQSIYEQRL